MKYAAIYYFENHPKKKGNYAVHVRFPDLLEVGLPASTVGSSLDDARDAAKDILELMFNEAEEQGLSLPDATPLHKIKIVIEGEYEFLFRIVIENIEI